MENVSTGSVHSYDDHLQEATPKLLAIPNEEVVDNPRVDGYSAAEVVEGGVKKAQAFEGQLGERFGPASAGRLAFLLILCGAARQGEANVTAADRSRDLEELHEQLRAAYDLAEAKAMVAVKQGRLEERKLAGARNLHGYDNAARSALVLGQILRENRDRLGGAITEEEIDQLDGLARRLTTGVTERNQGIDVAPARDLKNRAITLLIKEHDELRRDMTWLRWHAGDVDELVPSIWSGRGRKGKGDEEPEVITPTPAPAPTPNDGGPFTG